MFTDTFWRSGFDSAYICPRFTVSTKKLRPWKINGYLHQLSLSALTIRDMLPLDNTVDFRPILQHFPIRYHRICLLYCALVILSLSDISGGIDTMRGLKPVHTSRPSCSHSRPTGVAANFCSDVIDPSDRYSIKPSQTQQKPFTGTRDLGSLADLRHPTGSKRVGFSEFLD